MLVQSAKLQLQMMIQFIMDTVKHNKIKNFYIKKLAEMVQPYPLFEQLDLEKITMHLQSREEKKLAFFLIANVTSMSDI